MKNWNVLKEKDIIDLMIGDSAIESDGLFDYTMPSMSGPSICEFGGKFGLNIDYWNSEKMSRWLYMKKILDYVIDNNLINLFFKELLDLKRFKDTCKKNIHKNASSFYWECVSNFMNKINESLFFDRCHIKYDLNTWQFNLIDDEDNIKIETQSINSVNRQYIISLKEQIYNAINDGDYESAVTKSRTLLEEIMIYGIELKNEEVEKNLNINKIYGRFKTLYGMHQNKEMDKRINGVLSGLEKIISSITDMRDENSDSHGVGKKRIKIEKHHSMLFANAAITMSEFILSVVYNKNDL